MRPIREHPPQRHLTTGTGSEDWTGAPCFDLDIAFLWDLELDGNGAWAPAETKAQQRQGHVPGLPSARVVPGAADEGAHGRHCGAGHPVKTPVTQEKTRRRHGRIGAQQNGPGRCSRTCCSGASPLPIARKELP